ncbi:MAG TPA: TlpA disulfide reductase family protein [Thermoanaerobaculia bacterium]|nr:TlpA disulfide reductase family protein [Thermoanaerobaculia bacterium]
MRTTRVRRPPASAVILALGVLALAAAPVPRKSPEFTIVEPAGKQTQLSSLKAKVVAVEFFLTTCPRCWRLAATLAKLGKELGPRGFQPIGIAFDNHLLAPAVTDFVARSGVTYPVGYSTAEKVDGYLGREGRERFQVPQIVVIDRTGVIRAQSRPSGEVNLESESYLRNLIDSLLKE